MMMTDIAKKLKLLEKYSKRGNQFLKTTKKSCTKIILW